MRSSSDIKAGPPYSMKRTRTTEKEIIMQSSGTALVWPLHGFVISNPINLSFCVGAAAAVPATEAAASQTSSL